MKYQSIYCCQNRPICKKTFNAMKDLKKKLINFELKIKKIYEKGKVKGPIHLSGGNESQLIKIFKKIRKNDWIISNWRSHYHAILHGISEKKILREILKDDDELLINSLLDSCLNDRRFEQKYIDSRTVVLPALL